MKATLLKTEKRLSRYGGYFYYSFFKGKNGKSYYSCLYPKMRNFEQWRPFIMRVNVELDGLKLVKGKNRLVDADSPVKEIN